MSLLIVALGGIVYIISGHLSELENGSDADDGGFGIKAKFVDWVNKLPLDDVKNQSLSLTQKTLHRLRLVLLKADNQLMKIIGKMAERDKMLNGNGSNAAGVEGGKNPNDNNFWEDLSKKDDILKNVEETPDDRLIADARIELAVKQDTGPAEKFLDIKPVKGSSRSKRTVNKPR